jgi:hypothetical protein
MLSLAKEIREEEPPEQLKNEIMSRVRKSSRESERREGPAWIYARRALPAVAAGIVIVAFAYIFSSNGLLDYGKGNEAALADSPADERAGYLETGSLAFTAMESACEEESALQSKGSISISIDTGGDIYASDAVGAIIDEVFQKDSTETECTDADIAGDGMFEICVDGSQFDDIVDMLNDRLGDYCITIYDPDEYGTVRISINKE